MGYGTRRRPSSFEGVIRVRDMSIFALSFGALLSVPAVAQQQPQQPPGLIAFYDNSLAQRHLVYWEQPNVIEEAVAGGSPNIYTIVGNSESIIGGGTQNWAPEDGSDITGYYDGAYINIAYISTEGHLIRLHRDLGVINNGYYLIDITQANNAMPPKVQRTTYLDQNATSPVQRNAIIGTTLASFADPSYQHIFYIGMDGLLYESYAPKWTDNWQTHQIGGQPQATDGRGLTSIWDDQRSAEHVFFNDAAGGLFDNYYANGKWTLTEAVSATSFPLIRTPNSYLRSAFAFSVFGFGNNPRGQYQQVQLPSLGTYNASPFAFGGSFYDISSSFTVMYEQSSKITRLGLVGTDNSIYVLSSDGTSVKVANAPPAATSIDLNWQTRRSPIASISGGQPPSVSPEGKPLIGMIANSIYYIAPVQTDGYPLGHLIEVSGPYGKTQWQVTDLSKLLNNSQGGEYAVR
jgi:hypothetical protein